MSEGNKSIYSAFVKAQTGFAPALKTSVNPHFKSRYAALDACIEAVIDALNSNGIALVQRTHECATGVTVETLFVHESGETLSGGTLHIPSTKMDAQAFGSALSYARRYSLMAACGIAPEDDDGNAASVPPKSVQQTAKPAAPTTTEKKPGKGFDAHFKAICEAQGMDDLFRIAGEVRADSTIDSESRKVLLDKYGEIESIFKKKEQ